MSDPEVYLTRDEIEHPYANLAVMIEDKRRKAKEMKKTIFDRITQSPEVLAEKLVFWMSWHKADGSVEWFAVSTIADGKWGTREEAIAATVAKLKEVCDAERH